MKFVAYILFLLAMLSFSPDAYALGDPVKISTSSNATTFPQVTTDASGYLHLVWMEVANENSPWSGQNPGILYSRWNGDTWSAPLTISENTDFAEIPSIAADSTNTVHAVWDDETYGSGDAKVAYKTRSGAGVWSAIETIPTPAGTSVNWNARVAIGSSNVPNVVFSGISNTSAQSSMYWTRKVAGNWTTPEIVSKDASDAVLTDCQWADAKNDLSGTIYITYWCWNEGIFYRNYNGTVWSTPVQITSATAIDYPRMAVTPAGQVFVTWYQNSDTSVRVRWTISGVWQSETTLTTAGAYSSWFFPIIGVTTDSKERAHVGWGELDGGGLVDLKYKTYSSGVWGTAQDVDLDNNDADTPFVYPDIWDNQHFAWTEKNPSTSQWEIYYRVAEGTIQSVTTAGATITVDPNSITYATLAIPNGGLSATTQIGIQVGPVPESVGTSQATIPRSFTFRPNGLVFNSASTATVFYTDVELAGADERLLKPWFWNSQTSAWEARDGSVNRAQNRIAVSLNGFSLYGISAPLIAEPTWSSPTPNEIVKQGSKLVEFSLTYKDGTAVLPPAAPDELKLLVKNESGSTIKTLQFEPTGLIREGNKNVYKGTLNFQKENLPNGVYTLEVYLADTLAGVTSFTLSK